MMSKDPFDAYQSSRCRDALLELLQSSQGRVYNVCYQVLGQHEDAEDATQEVLLRLINDLGKIADSDHFKRWLFRASLQVALDTRKKRRRRIVHETKGGRSAVVEREADDPTDILHHHLAGLDGDNRGLIVERYFERRPLRVLAAEVGISVVAVWKRLEKAKESLRNSMRRAGEFSASLGVDSYLQGIVPAAVPNRLGGPEVLAKAIATAAPESTVPSFLMGGIVMKAKSIIALGVLALAGILFIGHSVRANREQQDARTERAARPAKAKPRRPANAVAAVSEPLPSPVSLEPIPEKLAAPEAAEPTAPSSLAELLIPDSAPVKALKWLMKAQNKDGSWGAGEATLSGHRIGPVGLTGLCLLPLLGAGYTSLSKETMDGQNVGETIQKAVDWLKANRDGNGIGDPALNQALASLALLEVHGLTASPELKRASTESLKALMRLQKADGSWGDPYQSLWASMAIKSAQLSGLPLDANCMGSARAYMTQQLDAGPNLPAMIGTIFLNPASRHPALAETQSWLVITPPSGLQQDYAYWYMGTLALFQYSVGKGDTWNLWSDRLKATLMPAQQKEGFWSGSTPENTMVHTALGATTLEVFNRLSSAGAQKK